MQECKVSIRDISDYSFPDSKLILVQRWPKVITYVSPMWKITSAQCNFAHRCNIAPTGWCDIGPWSVIMYTQWRSNNLIQPKFPKHCPNTTVSQWLTVSLIFFVLWQKYNQYIFSQIFSKRNLNWYYQIFKCFLWSMKILSHPLNLLHLF